MSHVHDGFESTEWSAAPVRSAEIGNLDRTGTVLRVAPQSGLPLRWSANGPVSYRDTAGRAFGLAVKRLLDVMLSLLALVLLSPLLIVVAMAIKLTSPGPVLFTQPRVGRHGKIFMTYKFRSMRVDSGDPTGVRQTTPNDDRITPLGRWLRQSSVDELPQLLNIVRGDMSIIGPRPHVPGMKAAGIPYEQLIPYYELRYAMRPGLSGWAQANGLRGPTSNAITARSRINHDIAYIQNFSVLLDLRTIVLTLRAEFLGGSGV